MRRGSPEKPEQVPEPSGDALERPGKFGGDGFENKPQHDNRDGEYADDQLAQPPDDEDGTEEDFEECAHEEMVGGWDENCGPVVAAGIWGRHHGVVWSDRADGGPGADVHHPDAATWQGEVDFFTLDYHRLERATDAAHGGAIGGVHDSNGIAF